MSIVVGFSGGIGSGKTHLSSEVARAFGWKTASFGNYVRGIAQERKVDLSNIVALQNIGQELIDHHLEPFCQAVLKQAGWLAGESLVIDGIRHGEVATTLRALVAPSTFRLVFVETSKEVRNARIGERMRSGAMYASDDLETLDGHRSEAQVLNGLANTADLIVNGALNQHQLGMQIIDWVRGQLAIANL